MHHMWEKALEGDKSYLWCFSRFTNFKMGRSHEVRILSGTSAEDMYLSPNFLLALT